VLRFLGGIVIVQTVTVVLVVATDLEFGVWRPWWPVLLALGVIALVAAFWLSALARHLRRDEVERLKAGFARERETLRVRAEREKTRIVRQSHKTIEKQTRRTEARASMKVGAAFTAAAGVGLLMLLTNFVTLGLLTITGAGGALGGWLLHRYQAAGTGPLIAHEARLPWRKWLPDRRA
jgi:Flp pilus assembly protein TadB